MPTANGKVPAAAVRLHQDHCNFIKLLNVLRHQQQLLAAGVPANWDIERGAISFYRRYIGQFHHRLEDAIYETLQARAPEAAAQVENIHQEHRSCSELLECFEGALILISGSTPVVRKSGEHLRQFYDRKLYEHYCFQLDEFVARERRHMSDEEALLSLAIAHLSSDDWRKISEQLSEGDDELFGEKRVARFDRLREAIFAADQRPPKAG